MIGCKTRSGLNKVGYGKPAKEHRFAKAIGSEVDAGAFCMSNFCDVSMFSEEP
jgi:hypothetical protein